MLNKETKLQPNEDVKLKFDTKLYTASVDRVERKIKRIHQYYLGCLDSL